jgi:glycerol-3-phosphate cytidylyltransferase-like family protein
MADDKIGIAQEAEDLEHFGKRPIPVDIAEVPAHDEPIASPTPPSTVPPQTDKTSTAHDLSSSNMKLFDQLDPDMAPETVSEEPNIGQIDWNAAPSGMEAWLNASAFPTPSTAAQAVDNAEVNNDLLQQEQQDLEALKSVHFVSLVPETQPLSDKVKDYQDLNLDAQIHIRKIVDRFPKLPTYLAKRFANANVRRMERLRLQRGDADEDADADAEPASSSDTGDED